MSEIRVDTISEKTSANGVAIDSVTLKDGGATLTDNITFSASGKGVHLGVTSATASNLLDDYEEGTWTLGLVESSGTALSTDINEGRYTKIGRTVCVNAWVRVTNLNGQTGAVTGTGLPFTVSNANSAYAGNHVSYSANLNLNSSSGFACMADKNATTLWFRVADDGGGYDDTLTATEISSNGQFMLQFFYTTDA